MHGNQTSLLLFCCCCSVVGFWSEDVVKTENGHRCRSVTISGCIQLEMPVQKDLMRASASGTSASAGQTKSLRRMLFFGFPACQFSYCQVQKHWRRTLKATQKQQHFECLVTLLLKRDPYKTIANILLCCSWSSCSLPTVPKELKESTHTKWPPWARIAIFHFNR